MKKKRTQGEINRQIQGLQKMRMGLPKRNFFGDDNHASIDAQIAVLKGERRPNDYDNNLFHEADRADEWLIGNNEDDLFEL